MGKPDVVSIGECLMALVADELGPLSGVRSFSPHLAGAEANVCVGLARLGHRAALVGRVGDDGFGRTIVRGLRGEGVDVTYLRVDPGGPTGLLIRERRTLGPAEVDYYRRDSAGSRLEEGDVEAAASSFTDARWLHLTGITPALSPSARAAVRRALELARESAVRISLDLNVRRKLWSETQARNALSPLLAGVDVVLADASEAAIVSGGAASADPADLARELLAHGPRLVVIKLGAEGALRVEQGGELLHRPAVRVTTVVDAIGAGDAFAAGYLSGDLDGLSPSDALDRANACGAFAISALGDMAGMPTRAELERFLASAGSDVWR